MSVARRFAAHARLVAIDAGDLALAGLMATAVAIVRRMPERGAADAAGAIARTIGTALPRSRTVGLANIELAFPDKTDAERRKILEACWDNLGRLVVEYCHLDRIWDYDPDRSAPGRIETASPEVVDRFRALAARGGPAIVVSAHLANWELPMLAAAAHGLDAAALYRAPSNRWAARWVLGQRKVAMGRLVPSRFGSMHRLSEELAAGRVLGMLTDQFFHEGVRAPFFGEETLCNQAFARLARLHDCPVHAVRVVRLPGDRFSIDFTDALPLPRDGSGRIDVAGAVNVVNQVFEGWVREHPGQWLWLHRKWRREAKTFKEMRRATAADAARRDRSSGP